MCVGAHMCVCVRIYVCVGIGMCIYVCVHLSECCTAVCCAIPLPADPGAAAAYCPSPCKYT